MIGFAWVARRKARKRALRRRGVPLGVLARRNLKAVSRGRG